jgi:hypothetical protein
MGPLALNPERTTACCLLKDRAALTAAVRDAGLDRIVPFRFSREAVSFSRLAPSPETPDFASSFRLREATSGKAGGYVGQDFGELSRVAVLEPLRAE